MIYTRNNKILVGPNGHLANECGIEHGDDCEYCDAGKTPKQVTITFSGIIRDPDCNDTGSDSYWYAIRYYNSSTEAVGPFSDLTQGGASSTIKRLRDMIDDNGTTKAFDNDDLREILTRNSDDDTDTELKKSSVECLKMLLASAARRADYVQGNTKVDFSTVFDHIKHLLEMYQGEVSQDTGSSVPRIGKRIHPAYEDDD